MVGTQFRGKECGGLSWVETPALPLPNGDNTDKLPNFSAWVTHFESQGYRRLLDEEVKRTT